MSGETILTVVGNLVADPELRFTPSGAGVASFTLASTPRTFDRQANEWRDGDPLFMRCSVWRAQAENVAECLRKGNRVMVTGRLKQRSFETREGEKRTVIELDADEVCASLKFTRVNVQTAQRGSSAPPRDDPWSRPAGEPADPWTPAASGGAGFADEPPF